MSFENLIELEKKLENKEYRASREKLEELMHPEFREVISNGEVWGREKVIQALIETSDQNDYNAFDFEAFGLGLEIGTVLFKTKNEDGSKITQRSSTWKKENGKWQNIFHHATNKQAPQ